MHAVLAYLLEPDGREVGHAVGGDVFTRVAHFVHQLLADAGHGDATARARVLRHVEAAVGIRFHDRVSDVGEVGDALPVHEAVSSAALRAAFDRVSRHRAGGE